MMNLSQNQQTRSLALKAVRHNTYTGEKRPVPVYLHFAVEAGKLRPIKLGTGRSAVVLLATDYASLQAGGYYFAVKFLREDPDPQYSEASAARFFTEVNQMQQWGRGGGHLVNYVGWGSIAKDPTLKDTRGGIKEFWWDQQFLDYDPDNPKHDPKNPVLDNNGKEFKTIKQVLKLQGPFYIMNLCQGTLEDLLEGSEPWSMLPVYQWIERFAQGLEAAQSKTKDDVKWFFDTYLDSKKPKASGYDILNSFRTDSVPVEIKIGANTQTIQIDASRIRTHAVLQLFQEIAGTVDNLHQGNQTDLKPLAHRDIKPGNIFIQHPFDKLTETSFRLSDLGYVSSLQELTSFGNVIFQSVGDTGTYDRRGLVYQAPGSQFYRAPEQADLPIEVRVDVDPDQRHVIRVQGTKLSRIEPNDWLIIDDLQQEVVDEAFQVGSDGDSDLGEQQRADDLSHNISDLADPEGYSEATPPKAKQPVFTIQKSDPDPKNKDSYTLVLDKPVLGSELNNLHAQITKSTGFHTDGYSLGAILYDLISGGKNPEHFYTYCLRVFTKEFTQGRTNEDYDSVEAIINVLCPLKADAETPDSLFVQSFKPQNQADTFDELRPQDRPKLPPWSRLKTMWATRSADNADVFVDRVIDIIYRDQSSNDAQPLKKPLTWGDIWLQARTANDADGMLNQIADLVYQNQPPENPLTWQSIWQIVRAARTASSADEFLDRVTDLIYKEQSQLPTQDSIWQIVKATRSGINADRFLERVVNSIYLDRPLSEKDRKSKIRNLQFRNFHVIDDLLRDKRNEEIPQEIIRLIVSCMMRSIEGSLYGLHSEFGYNSIENTRAIAKLREEVDDLLQTTFDLELGSVPASFRENILFGLRCLGHEDVRNASPAPQPAVADTPETPHTEATIIIDTQATEMLPPEERSVGADQQVTVLMEKEPLSDDQTQQQ